MTTTEARVELIDETQLRMALQQAMSIRIADIANSLGSPRRVGEAVRVYVKIDDKPRDDFFLIEHVDFTQHAIPERTVVELNSDPAEYGDLDARIEATFEDNKFIGVRLLKYGVLEEKPE